MRNLEKKKKQTKYDKGYEFQQNILLYLLIFYIFYLIFKK